MAKGEDVLLTIETKSKIPSYGSKALRRLKDQLLAAQKGNATNVKVVGVDKISNNRLEKSLGYLERAGVDLSAIDFFNGALEFARWSAEVYFEECIED
ncbi:hypothetical protein [Oceanobacter mangrovi]|uniref:hypothetical protein n=1 Tax=Oceanobacter mangrovi TaxID=2862510 RepID=UPI001C8F014F|nr:hypothetical protein [Oceanobacter mangrovi]